MSKNPKSIKLGTITKAQLAAYFKRIGSAGGKKSSANMTKAQRVARAKKASDAASRKRKEQREGKS